MRATPEVSCLDIFHAAGQNQIECSNSKARLSLYLEDLTTASSLDIKSTSETCLSACIDANWTAETPTLMSNGRVKRDPCAAIQNACIP